jgi:hypothetical protein
MLMEIDPNAEDIVSKCSWVGKSYLSIESKMLRTCGGMFGVMNYYHSGIVCHTRGVAATNHLLLKTPTFWRVFQQTERNHVPDSRMLIQQFSQFTGRSLVTISQPRDLFVAIAHAALGVYVFSSPS